MLPMGKIPKTGSFRVATEKLERNWPLALVEYDRAAIKYIALLKTVFDAQQARCQEKREQ
jgi:hypothetical protein